MSQPILIKMMPARRILRRRRRIANTLYLIAAAILIWLAFLGWPG